MTKNEKEYKRIKKDRESKKDREWSSKRHESSVTRLGEFLHFGQLFEAFSNN